MNKYITIFLVWTVSFLVYGCFPVNESEDVSCEDNVDIAMMNSVNDARLALIRCGDEQYTNVPPVIWNEKLAEAAYEHSRDMALNNYFDHLGMDGSTVGDRVSAAGYSYTQVAENIAGGFGKSQDCVDLWLKSVLHCQNLMNPEYTEIGAACYKNSNSDYVIYWTLVLAKPATQ